LPFLQMHEFRWSAMGDEHLARRKANCERDKPKATIAATYWLLCV
jgi:hypothetical protein